MSPNRWGGDWNLIRKKKNTHPPCSQFQRKALDRILRAIESPEFNKLGVMLYGTPGCGKTDLVVQLVSRIGYNLYYFNLSDMDDSKFIEMMTLVRTPAILLFEDIDCCKVTHSRIEKKKKIEEKKTEQKQSEEQKTEEENKEEETTFSIRSNTPSLSTVLNVFDGVLSMDDQIIIATTNHYNKLDGALSRKGRFDITIELQQMLKDDICDFIARKYKEDPDVIEDIMNTYEISEGVIWKFPISDVAAVCKEFPTCKEALEQLQKIYLHLEK